MDKLSNPKHTNTFLPYRDFNKCAKVLDNRRLLKQILEAYQIHRAITGKTKGWRNHPAVLMWKKEPGLLAYYGWKMCREFEQRTNKTHAYAEEFFKLPWGGPDFSRNPRFLSNKLIRQYRSLLLRKNPEHYRKYWKKLRSDIPFRWPDGTVSKV